MGGPQLVYPFSLGGRPGRVRPRVRVRVRVRARGEQDTHGSRPDSAVTALGHTRWHRRTPRRLRSGAEEGSSWFPRLRPVSYSHRLAFPRPRAPGSRFPWGWETCADTLGGGWREVVASHSVPQMFPKPSVSVPLSPGPLFWWQTTVLPHAGTPCQPSRPFHYLLLLNIFFRLLKSTFLSRSFGFAV